MTKVSFETISGKARGGLLDPAEKPLQPLDLDRGQPGDDLLLVLQGQRRHLRMQASAGLGQFKVMGSAV